jgi:hypothetical protein
MTFSLKTPKKFIFLYLFSPFAYRSDQLLNDFSEVFRMKKLEKMAFSFEERQLDELRELSKKTGVPQAIFIREALRYILKKYRYLLTMKKFNPEEARYLLSGSRDVEERPPLRIPFSPVKNRKRLNSKRFLLDFKKQSEGEDQP